MLKGRASWAAVTVCARPLHGGAGLGPARMGPSPPAPGGSCAAGAQPFSAAATEPASDPLPLLHGLPTRPPCLIHVVASFGDGPQAAPAQEPAAGPL